MIEFHHKSLAGCDSVVTLTLTVSATTAAVSYGADSATLVCQTTGAAYQWLDCTNGYQAIDGATADTLKPTVTGAYAVVVTAGSCVDTSDCFEVIVKPDFVKNFFQNDIVCYPNPTNNFVTMEGLTDGATVKVCDITGRVMLSFTAKSEKMNVDLSAYSNGLYLFVIENGTNRIVNRIVKN